uniref:Sodium-coupled monocarboxylate transporter 1 n=1 Tax=Biomphalaria glabrata TaxID=6526 RepID=A0A2C9JMB6_BIOGL
MSTNTGPRSPIYYGGYSFNTGKVRQFQVVDYTMFAAVLIFSGAIGMYHAINDRKKKTLEQFFLAGKDMNPVPVGLSMLASFMPAITFLGLPAEIYTYNIMSVWIGLSYFFVMAVAAHVYMPIFYHLQVTSCFQYLEKRFSRGVRSAASLCFVVQMVVYMSVVLYAPSLALNAVTGFTLWGSVLSVGAVSTVYTALGGMKAVLWTDTFQVFVILSSLIVLLMKGQHAVGGVMAAWGSIERTDRAEYLELGLYPSVRHSVWSLVIGGLFSWLSIFGVNQVMVQRAVTCPTLCKAKIAMWVNLPGMSLILYLCWLIGFFMSAFYENCDPILAGLAEYPGQIVPLFVMDVLSDIVLLPGLFVAGLFSCSLSTMSSGLNSVAACLMEDLVKAYFVKDISDSKARLLSQLLALLLGAACLAMTFVVAHLGRILQVVISLHGLFGGPQLGLFSLGMFFPWSNSLGAYASLLGSLALMLWIGIGAAVVKPPQKEALYFTNNCNASAFGHNLLNRTLSPVDSSIPLYDVYTLSYMWYGLTGFLAALVIGTIVSLITGVQKPKDVDPKLICPFFDIVYPFALLPECIRKPLRFGVDHSSQKGEMSSLMELDRSRHYIEEEAGTPSNEFLNPSPRSLGTVPSFNIKDLWSSSPPMHEILFNSTPRNSEPAEGTYF